MSLLVFGKTGQVAHYLQELAPVTALGREDADLGDPQVCAAAIERYNPSAVINAAAYTAVDRAEDEEELANIINGAAPGIMARSCAAAGIPFVHISTDYVFDGKGEVPWRPDDSTSPISAYGRSKLIGEQAVSAACGHSVILRTSWVFSAVGSNFVKTMLRLGKERNRLSIVADQIGNPTPARAIAAACLEIALQLKSDPGKSGIYHFSGQPETSWAGFAREIFAIADLPCAVDQISTSDYPTPAQRPLNSRLDCSSTKAAFGIDCPDWRKDLLSVVNTLECKDTQP